LAEYPVFFTNDTTTRNAVRYERGERTAYSRGDKRKVISPIPRTMPVAEPPEFKVVEIKPGHKWLTLSDLHIPYHDVKAIEAAVAYGKEQGVTALLINGDMMDCYSLSKHERDPRKIGIATEVERVKQFLDYIDGRLDLTRIVYKLGNHEERKYRFLCANAPQLLDLPQFSWENLLDLSARGIELVEAPWIMTMGKLTILHGHEWGNGISNPVNPARGAFLRAGECCFVGHSHRTSHHNEATISGRQVSTWSTGCLCDLNPRYRPVGNKWDLGFGIIDYRNEDWAVHTLRIINGKVHR
jgi:predicted phosphodiesterase